MVPPEADHDRLASANARRVLAALVVALFRLRGARAELAPAPVTAGRRPGSYTIQASSPMSPHSSRNSLCASGRHCRQRRRDRAARLACAVTCALPATSSLPANADRETRPTSLLGSVHVELAPPTDVPRHRAAQGSLMPLSSAGMPAPPPSRPCRRYRCSSTGAGSATPRHRRDAEHRIRRTRTTTCEASSTNWTNSSATSTTSPPTLSRPRTNSTTWLANSPPHKPWSTGRCRPFPTRWPCSTTSAHNSSMPSTSSANSPRSPLTPCTRPRTACWPAAPTRPRAGIACQRRPCDDPRTQPAGHLSLAQRDP